LWLWSDALPVEGVVKVLSSIVEYCNLLCVESGLDNDLVKWQCFEWGARDQAVQLVDVGLVVLVVVKVKLLRGNAWLYTAFYRVV